MVRKSYTPEQIINKLREVEILLNQGANLGEACRKIGVTEQTYYRWRNVNRQDKWDTIHLESNTFYAKILLSHHDKPYEVKCPIGYSTHPGIQGQCPDFG